jgi:hypothetical protein
MAIKRVRKANRKRKYKGGADQTPQQQVVAPAPAPAPQAMVQQPASVPQAQLRVFQKKIRINVTPEFKSVIQAPEEAEYILSERLNAQAKYGNPDVYIGQFGNDEETGSPIDVYTEYIYERLKDLGKKDCQILKHRGDAPVESSGFLGIGASTTSRRQNCAASINDVKKDDNRILKLWIDDITKNGIQFLEGVNEYIEKVTEQINDLNSTKNEKLADLKDSTNTLNDNINGINRETQQRLQEITRLIQDKESGLSDKIDAEITDLQSFIREETSIVQEIEKLEAVIKQLDGELDTKMKELAKIQSGIANANAALKEQGIDLEKLVQEIERSIQMNMTGGKRRRNKKSSRKPRKKRSKKKASRKKRGRPKKASSSGRLKKAGSKKRSKKKKRRVGRPCKV